MTCRLFFGSLIFFVFFFTMIIIFVFLVFVLKNEECNSLQEGDA